MYQSPYNRYPRKKRVPGAIKLLVAILVIGIIVVAIRYLSSFVSKMQKKPTETNSTTGSTLQADRYVGKDISIAGTLSGSTDPLSYSHTLITTGDDIVRLNSSTIDLHTYSGFVYIKGTVSKFNGNNATVQVKAIGNTEGDLQSTSFAPSSDVKFLSSIGLKLDTSENKGITYTIKDNTLSFSSDTVSGTAELQGFKCEVGFPEKDCTKFAKEYTGSSFVNRAGLTITKNTSGSTWFARNNAGAGYIITASSDALLYKVSSILVPINETYIKTLLPSIIKLCTPGTNVSNPTVAKESINSWIVKTTDCTARVTIDDKDGEKVTILSKSEAATIKTGTTTTPTSPNISSSGSTVPSTTNQSPAPKLSGSGHDFTSTRGNYTIHFPSAGISYNGTNITENLGVKGLNCYVNIGIKSYADRENDAIGPAVEIYECTSKLPSSSINVPGTTMQTSTDGTKMFFIKTLNPNWNDFVKSINIK